MYSFKSDVYSVGMIIHFILSEKDYEKKLPLKLITETYDKKLNILSNNEFASIPQKFEFLKNCYRNCLNYSPKDRPTIVILNAFFVSLFLSKISNESLTELNFAINTRVRLVRTLTGLTNQDTSEKFINDLFNNKISQEDKYKYFNFIEKNADKIGDISKLATGVYNLDNRLSNGDINKGIQCIIEAAKSNNFFAQDMLSRFYYYGTFVEQDIEKSIYYSKLAADQNNPEAQFFYGFIHYINEKVPRDIEKVIHYWKLSASQNNSKAQYFLGILYYEGVYFKQDINKAIYFFTLSADQKFQLAQYYIGKIYFEGIYAI